MSSGWFPDPSGRFGRRWYDGHSWTGRVVGASGAVVSDPLPEDAEPHPPPVAERSAPTAPPAPPMPPAPVMANRSGPPAPPGPPGPPPGPPSAPTVARPGPPVAVRRTGIPGLLLGIGLAGVLLSALSLLALPWADADEGRLTDFTGFLWENEVSADNIGFLLWTFVGFGAYAACGLVLVGVLLAGIPLGGRSGGWQRIVGASLAGLAALYQTATVAKLFAGPADAEPGAWLGVVGYFVVLAAMIAGGPVRRWAVRE